MKKTFLEILRSFRLSLLLYVLTAVLLFKVVDHLRVDLKTFDYLQDRVDYLNDFAAGKRPFSPYGVKEALRYYEHLLKYFPNTPTIHNAVGFCYYHLGKHDKALKFYKNAIALDKEVFGFYYNVGLIYIRQGKFADAIPVLRQAVAANPGRTLLYPDLVFPLNEAVDNTQSQEGDLRMKFISRAYVQCYKWLLLCYEKTGDNKRVRDTAMAAVSSAQEGKALFYYYAGVADFLLENYEEAAQFLKECLEMDYSFQPAYAYLAQALEKIGRPEAAANLITQQKELEHLGLLSSAGVGLDRKTEPMLFFYPPRRVIFPDGAGFLF